MPDRPVSVFAVEDDAVQLTWSALPASDLSLEVGGHTAAITGPGPGACNVTGLDPATRYEVTLAGPGCPRRQVAELTTLESPPGRELWRFATISDLHLGESRFGARGTIVDQVGHEPSAIRCARAAIAEAVEWGARLLLVKGDVTRDSEPAQFRLGGQLLAAAPVPVLVALGNHDVRHGIDGVRLLADLGIEATAAEARVQDLPGIRIVMAHSAVSRHQRGELGEAPRHELIRAAREADGPVFVAVHHQPNPRAISLSYPRGIVRRHSRAFLDGLAAANPATFVTAGHTHRNRCFRHGPLVVTEVGSTKDYPGVWAGYAVHEGGIRQVVRRVTDPEAMAWTDSTARALGGLWGPWAAGRTANRCFTHPWPS
jgi:3',5'-cyclic-AMP phosphodiesterase